MEVKNKWNVKTLAMEYVGGMKPNCSGGPIPILDV